MYEGAGIDLYGASTSSDSIILCMLELESIFTGARSDSIMLCTGARIDLNRARNGPVMCYVSRSWKPSLLS